MAKFNVPLAHLINAAADFLIIPSRFEPCGLIQLQAMPYGTVSHQESPIHTVIFPTTLQFTDLELSDSYPTFVGTSITVA